MPGVRDILERFRAVGTPGPAAAVGVPADRKAALEAELAPVLAQLEETEDQCEQVRASAHARAEYVRTDAALRAAAIVADARARAEAERADAATRERERNDVQAAGDMARAEKEAELVAVRAAERMPALVAHLLELARAELDASTTG